ncbi:gastrula zinc finger protein XlCGF57.1 [Eurytemora carolleeae]|uniref:gastrula zinc finger protein XlCGF57.1 n=1 Tax=Eurytemora carolleeae TaxID=1294199 RepID=UPI000C77986E|nr:gastrula zinc finger protein XlCGF57.1 [Eurytemora carolleeae]|eukprot:XP_023320610.1 gastrula zinc finger protein XlCGF57.1-like [Eurytemora affinis]
MRPSTPGKWGRHVQDESENVDEGIEDERFYCDACGRSFLTDGMLQTHISIVHSVRPTDFRKIFPCPFCNKRFTFRPNVRKHAKLVHRKPIEQAVSPVPPAGSVSPTDFSPSVSPEPDKLAARATKGMSQEGPMEALCKVCGKFSKNKRGLVQHMQVHYGRVFKCEVRGCKGSFTERSKLRRHMVVHTGERKFECPLCKTKFSLRHNLKVHLKIHERDEKDGRKLTIMDQDVAVDLKESKKMGKTSQVMADVDMSPTTEDIEMFIAAMEGEPIQI